MTPSEPGWSSEWSIRLRVWAERDGQALLGPGRLELLEAIDRWRSISAAARQIGMSYRHAWLLVQSINAAAGKPLVESAVGGSRGGGASLTELGQLSIGVFREVQREVQQAAVQILPRVLKLGERRAVVHIAAAISLEEVLGQLLADYALRQPAVRVRAVFGASNELADHVLAGAPCDLFLSADAEQIERLRRAGLCRAKDQRAIARNALSIVVPADAVTAIRRPQDLARPEVERIAIADPESPLGRYTQDYLARLGLEGRLRDRAVTADNSRGVLAILHAGRADAGLVYGSDAAMASGVRIVFRARTSAVVAEYRAAVLENARSAAEAQALLTFMVSPPAARKFRHCGFLAAAK